jgi:hypothetical protein
MITPGDCGFDGLRSTTDLEFNKILESSNPLSSVHSL